MTGSDNYGRRGSAGRGESADFRGANHGGNRGDNRGDNRGEKRGEKRVGNRGDNRDGGKRGAGSRRARGGSDDRPRRSSSPQRAGFREERINNRQNDPDIPADIDVNDLDPSVLQDLRSLSKENAEATAKHMIMAAMWMQDDPLLALRHARAAKDRAGRVSVAREVNGIAAYHAGEWKEALAELRAARRISGGPGMLAVMADCERGMGRPEKAIELGRSEEAAALDRDGAIELAIVVAGARHDLEQHDSALVTLEQMNPSREEQGMGACRLAYAYADALLQVGRSEAAKEWFNHAHTLDQDGWTDAAARLEELQ